MYRDSARVNAWLAVVIAPLVVIGCATSGHASLCDAERTEGWTPVSDPSPQMKRLLGAKVAGDGNIYWFEHQDGRVRACDALEKCAISYATVNPSDPEAIQTVVTSCPGPY